MGSSTTTSTETRALDLLGKGINIEQTAAAIGVSVSRISQLLSDPEFSKQVTEERFKNLTKHASRDDKYDALEDKLIAKMEESLPYMVKSGEILNALIKINSAKRRGTSTPESIQTKKEVVQLIMPVQIINQFQKNSQNQVIQAGEQQLITVQSGSMKQLLQQHGKQTQEVIENVYTSSSGTHHEDEKPRYKSF